MVADDPAAGVPCGGVEWLRDDGPNPWSASAVPDLVRVRDGPPGLAIGWRFTAPVVDHMSRYLPWLEARLAARGVVLERRRWSTWARSRASWPTAPASVHASWRDPSVTPIRGQVVLVEQVGLDEWVVDDGDGRALTYVVPCIDDVVVGGTAEPGADDLAVDPGDGPHILERATALVPALAGARVLRATRSVCVGARRGGLEAGRVSPARAAPWSTATGTAGPASRSVGLRGRRGDLVRFARVAVAAALARRQPIGRSAGAVRPGAGRRGRRAPCGNRARSACWRGVEQRRAGRPRCRGGRGDLVGPG